MLQSLSLVQKGLVVVAKGASQLGGVSKANSITALLLCVVGLQMSVRQ